MLVMYLIHDLLFEVNIDLLKSSVNEFGVFFLLCHWHFIFNFYFCMPKGQIMCVSHVSMPCTVLFLFDVNI